MNWFRSVRVLAALLSLPLAATALPAAAAQPAGADPITLCRRVYMPLVARGTSINAPAPIIEMDPTECQGFPDFNGDGYADLAMGAPNQDVSNGIAPQDQAGAVHVIYGGAQRLYASTGQSGPDDQIFHHNLNGAQVENGDHYGAALATGDFDHDGFDDLAVGIPGARIDGKDGAGAVQVLYGGRDGLSAQGSQRWVRGLGGLFGTAAAGDSFGMALAAGDFNGDGMTDLAAAAPNATVDSEGEAGEVNILFGTVNGLTNSGQERFNQNTNGFNGSPAEEGDQFGFALAAGDFNHDLVADLAVGTPYEDNGMSYADAGLLQIVFGQVSVDSGLIKFGSLQAPQHLTVDSDNVDGVMEADELFGFALAAGDFNGDDYVDLAVGTPHESHGSGPDTIYNGGSLNIFSGNADGLVPTAEAPARIWHQDVTNVADVVAADEFFGQALTTGDFNKDGYADLAVGVPGNKLVTAAIGAAQVMYGSADGITADDDMLVYDTINPQDGDAFGRALTAGDFDGDGFVDLAVGAPQDDPQGAGTTNSGSVFVFYSDASGVVLLDNQNWYPGHNNLAGTPENSSFFGAALPGSPDRP